jgi:hypothetical protein
MRKNIFYASVKSLKKGVGTGVVSGSKSQRYGSADPDPHLKCHGSSTMLDNNVADPDPEPF